MAWISITIATLYEAKVAKLVDAADAKALKAGQPNRSAGIIQGVVDEVRRKVASCKTNLVDADATTIPSGLRDLTVDMVIARLKKSIEMELSQDERDGLAQRERDLNRIANCEDVVDQPVNPIPAPFEATAPSPLFGQRQREFTRESQNG